MLEKEDRRYLKLFCTRIYMPNLNLDQLSSIGQRHMGIVRNVPNGPKYGGNVITTEIIENSNYSMYNAMRKIFNMVGTNTNPSGYRRQQRLRFYEDYIFNIQIRKLEFPDGAVSLINSGILEQNNPNDVDDGYKVVATHTFENCYISEIGQIVYDSTATDDYLTYPVNFTYESYHHFNNPMKDEDGKEIPMPYIEI